MDNVSNSSLYGLHSTVIVKHYIDCRQFPESKFPPLKIITKEGQYTNNAVVLCSVKPEHFLDPEKRTLLIWNFSDTMLSTCY
jgi:hypothetical protein